MATPSSIDDSANQPAQNQSKTSFQLREVETSSFLQVLLSSGLMQKQNLLKSVVNQSLRSPSWESVLFNCNKIWKSLVDASIRSRVNPNQRDTTMQKWLSIYTHLRSLTNMHVWMCYTTTFDHTNCVFNNVCQTNPASTVKIFSKLDRNLWRSSFEPCFTNLFKITGHNPPWQHCLGEDGLNVLFH